MADSDRKKPEPTISMRKRQRVDRKAGTPPAVAHGTRVRFQIECARCGKSDSLRFVPKTQGDMLCKSCAEEVFGADWAGDRPAEGRGEHVFECAQCGKEDRVRFEPDEDSRLLCSACFRGEEQPRKERLRGMTVVTTKKRRG